MPFGTPKTSSSKTTLSRAKYLAWYCENVTFQNCKIIGTQPLCYCKRLKLIGCEMIGCDLAFERSEVDAAITTPVLSIEKPLCRDYNRAGCW